MSKSKVNQLIRAFDVMKNKFLPLLLICALSAVFATGCNTTEGVGKDIEKAGNKIQDAAK